MILQYALGILFNYLSDRVMISEIFPGETFGDDRHIGPGQEFARSALNDLYREHVDKALRTMIGMVIGESLVVDGIVVEDRTADKS